MFDDLEELEELQRIAERAAHLNVVLDKTSNELKPLEYVQEVGGQIGIKVLPNQSPLYKTKEEAEAASKDPSLQVLQQFETAIVKDYLKLES